MVGISLHPVAKYNKLFCIVPGFASKFPGDA